MRGIRRLRREDAELNLSGGEAPDETDISAGTGGEPVTGSCHGKGNREGQIEDTVEKDEGGSDMRRDRDPLPGWVKF